MLLLNLKKLLILLLFFTCLNISYSQKIWTLEKCIDYARQNNINIKQQELNVKLAESDRLHSYANILPGINGFASHSYNYGLTVDRYTNLFATTKVQSDNFYLSGQVSLFNGFQNINNIKKSNIDLNASKYDVDKLVNDISFNIAGAYMQILYNTEILKTSQNQLDITNQQVEKNKKLFKAGTIAKGNLLAIEAQAATDELQVVNAKNTLDLSYLNLKLLLDLPANEAFDIEKPVFEITGEELIKENPDQIFATALSTQPEVKSAELKLESSYKSLSISQGMRSPQLCLQGSLGTGYSGAAISSKSTGKDTIPVGFTANDKSLVYSVIDAYSIEKTSFSKQINDNVNKSIGLSLTIPILNGLQAYTSISKSKIAIKNAVYNLQLMKNNLNKTIQQAYADANASYNKYTATRKNMEALEESYKYAQDKYDVGLLNFVDYNDSKTKFVKAQSDLLQAKYDYLYRIKVLDFYQGKAIY